MFSRYTPTLPRTSLLAAVLLGSIAVSPPVRADFQVAPATVSLEGRFARAQLVVTEKPAAGPVSERSADLSHQARYLSSNPGVVTADENGLLLARGDGSATVSVTVGGVSHSVAVTVKGLTAAPMVGFREHIMPVLSKAGCNAGDWHASQYGKGGFKLSVFGSAPEEDYRAIVRDTFGRRASTLAPSASLLLRKPTLAVPHEGGKRLEAGSVEYRLRRRTRGITLTLTPPTGRPSCGRAIPTDAQAAGPSAAALARMCVAVGR